MAEYGSMLLVSVLGATLFLGGWNGPLPITEWLGWADAEGGITWYLANLLGVVNVLVKGTLGVTVMIWIRWTLPRLRIDQVMTTCWKYCTPIVCVMFVGVSAWTTLGLPSLGRFIGTSEPFGVVESQTQPILAPPAPVAEPAGEPTDSNHLAMRRNPQGAH